MIQQALLIFAFTFSTGVHADAGKDAALAAICFADPKNLKWIERLKQKSIECQELRKKKSKQQQPSIKGP